MNQWTHLMNLERELGRSIRSGYLFGNHDEPLDAASRRIVRVIQNRIADIPVECECTDQTPQLSSDLCRACGGKIYAAETADQKEPSDG